MYLPDAVTKMYNLLYNISNIHQNQTHISRNPNNVVDLIYFHTVEKLMIHQAYEPMIIILITLIILTVK